MSRYTNCLSGVWAATLSLAAATGAFAQTQPTTLPAVNVIEQSAPPVVGTEGRIDVVLPYEDLTPAPASNRADLVLRVVERRQWGTGWRYDIRYVAAVPGTFDVVRALRREGEETAPSLPAIAVQATGVLPPQHDGTLGDVTVGRIRAWRWYWPLAAAVLVLWGLLLVPLIFWRRHRARQTASAEVTRVPTVAERLRPLVLAAAGGTLDADGQGRLERLLVHVWRQRLALGDLSPSAALTRMRTHPEAGPLLRAVEDWLHRPPGRHEADPHQIARLLEPYASLPAEDPVNETRPALATAGGMR